MMRYSYIINAKDATQSQSLKIAKDFGLHESSVAMLDGSGSSQMVSKLSNVQYGCASRLPYKCGADSRTIPQFMVVRKK
jgi:hypothetical protein